MDPETGLIYLRARYYDSITGQFLTRDPLEATTREPYAYVGDNPLNRIDPNGMSLISDLTGSAFSRAAGEIAAGTRSTWDATGGKAISFTAKEAELLPYYDWHDFNSKSFEVGLQTTGGRWAFIGGIAVFSAACIASGTCELLGSVFAGSLWSVAGSLWSVAGPLFASALAAGLVAASLLFYQYPEVVEILQELPEVVIQLEQLGRLSAFYSPGC